MVNEPTFGLSRESGIRMLALGASLFALAYVQPLAPLSSRSVVARSSVTQMGGPGAPAGTSGRVRPPPPA